MRITRLIRVVFLGRRNGLRARLWRRYRSGAEPTVGVPSAAADPVAPSPAARAGFEIVLNKATLPPGQVTEIFVSGKTIALANVGGEFFAFANTCAHAGGPLGDGTLDGHTVTCPYHGWTYDVRDGRCFVSPEIRQVTYEVELVGDAVCVRL